MDTKPLYTLVSNSGDGSFCVKYILDPKVIEMLEAAESDGIIDCESGPGCDGDGFHYSNINVPIDATKESLGISDYSFIDLQKAKAITGFDDEGDYK